MGFWAARWPRGWGGPMGCLAEVLDGRCHCIWRGSSWHLHLDVEECHQRRASEEISTQEKEGKNDSSRIRKFPYELPIYSQSCNLGSWIWNVH